MNFEHKEKLKNAVRFFYDLQKLRTQSGARATKKAESAEAKLDETDKVFLDKTADRLNSLEKDALKEVTRLLRTVPIYKEFLLGVKGCGPTMSGVLVSEINIENCNTVSQLWAWCGLSVVDGKAARRVKGQKTGFNPWLKSKLVKVLADCMLRAKSPYRNYYDNYKNRKENQLVEVCMGCNGEGKAVRRDDEAILERGDKRPSKKVKCGNCDGTGGPAPWGASLGHRHNAAMRYMIKSFLRDMWVEWRTLEGLEVREPYAEEYLGRKHHEKETRTNT